MMDFGRRLKEYRKKNNLTQRELGDIIKVSVKTVSAYETRGNRPTYDDLIKLCNTLKVDVHYFMKDELKYVTNFLSEDEQCILDAYSNLSPSNKRVVDFIFGFISTTDNFQTSDKIIYRLPVYEQEAAAGAGVLGKDGEYQMEDIITDLIPYDAVYGIRIKGESMSPDIPNSSLVLINPKIGENDLNDKVVIANFQGDIICKRFKVRADHIWFSSDNEEYIKDDRKAYSNDEYQIIGEVVKVIT